MKKLLVLAAAILMAGVASAQWNISGTLSFNNESNLGKIGNTETQGQKAHAFTIGVSPEYVFNSNWAAGIDICYSTSHSENGDNAGAFINTVYANPLSAEANSNLFGVTPYVRRNILTAGNLTVGLQLDFTYLMGNVTYKSANGKILNDNPVKAKQMRTSLYPVIGYNFNTKWSVDMYLDFLSVFYAYGSSSHEGEATGIVTTKSNSAFGAGIYGIEFNNDAYGTLNKNLMTFCIKYNL